MLESPEYRAAISAIERLGTPTYAQKKQLAGGDILPVFDQRITRYRRLTVFSGIGVTACAVALLVVWATPNEITLWEPISKISQELLKWTIIWACWTARSVWILHRACLSRTHFYRSLQDPELAS